MLIEPANSRIAVVRQCDLVALARSSWYYQPCRDDSYNEHLMHLLDEEYTRHPFRGIGQLTDWLRSEGHPINHKRVERLMKKMGIQAIHPKRHLSGPNPGHKIYPHLLQHMPVIRPNQVWCADITYIRLDYGFAYLAAVMDWYSRCVLSWRLSNTLDSLFCVAALEEALALYGRPEIFNTDQGRQFTGWEFISTLTQHGITISMDGKGRTFDNIFVERLWRTVKYENVYLYGYQNIPEARDGLRRYFAFYNRKRFHRSLGYKPPWQVYSGEEESQGMAAVKTLEPAIISLDSPGDRRFMLMPGKSSSRDGREKREKRGGTRFTPISRRSEF